MRTSALLPFFEGLGITARGFTETIDPSDKATKNRKVIRAGIDAMILETISLLFESLERYRRHGVYDALASVLTGNARFSIATAELFEIVVPAFTKEAILKDDASLLHSTYRMLNEMPENKLGHFLQNAALLVRNYNITDRTFIDSWISDIATLCLMEKTEEGLFSKMLYAVATDTEHDEIFTRTLKSISKNDAHLPLYWNAVIKILHMHADNKDKMLAAVSFIIDDERYLTVQPLPSTEEILQNGQKVINVLTWDYARQRGMFLESKSEVEFFSLLTSEHPRKQLLDAWKQFTFDKDPNLKGLYLLSRRADKKLPRKEGDDCSVEVTSANLHERFPLLV